MSAGLNAQQRAAVEHPGGHLLVLAGAGTGKTRTIIHRVAELLRRGVDPARVLMLTFTRRAAKEMTGRLFDLAGPAAERIFAGTFHSFCLQAMRRMPKPFEIEAVTVIDQDDQLQLFRLARGNYKRKGEQFPKAAELASVYSYARNTNRPLDAYLETHTEYDELTRLQVKELFKDYERRKRQGGYLDYDDILHRFARTLRQRPELRDRFRGLYSHILVDETQDCNPLQWLVLDALRDPAELFCVGDDAQSIYAFRGADFNTVHAFTERVPGSTTCKLEDNYRSTAEILELCNWLLEGSTLNYDKHLRSTRGHGPKPLLRDFDSDLDEADFVANDLLRRHDGGASWHDHMVITRSANAARSVEAALVGCAIPYRFVGGTSLLESAHVRDLLALVRCAASAQDDLAWMRYLTLFPGIGEVGATKAVAALREAGGVAAALETLEERFPTRPEITLGVRTTLAGGAPKPAIEIASDFLEPMLRGKYPKWEARRKDFKLLAKMAARHKTLDSFLDTYVLDPVTTAELQGDGDQVTVITAHSAKGTECPVCYVIRAEPGMYPHMRALGSEGGVEEERRVLYVAMTRAMDELILSRTSRDAWRRPSAEDAEDNWTQAEERYFLRDVPAELVDSGGDDDDDFPGDSHYEYDEIMPF